MNDLQHAGFSNDQILYAVHGWPSSTADSFYNKTLFRAHSVFS
jgi:hypothetical protein